MFCLSPEGIGGSCLMDEDEDPPDVTIGNSIVFLVL